MFFYICHDKFQYYSDRALDCDSDSANQIADVLGTLIKDLIAQGILTGSVSA